MKIQSSDVNFAAGYQYSKKTKEVRRVVEWQTSNKEDCREFFQEFSKEYEEQDFYGTYYGFAECKQRAYADNRVKAMYVNSIEMGQESMREVEGTRKVFQTLLELLFRNRERLWKRWNGYSVLDLTTGRGIDVLTDIAGGTSWTRKTEINYCVQEREATTFLGTGNAITADGRTIEFGVSFSLSRELCKEFRMESLLQYERVLTDPLVIQLDTSSNLLEEYSFRFDLNCDGVEEEISALSEHAGFLALDQNGDGIINDGGELFGTRSGNGFADLAHYDEDKNGWIDEGDEIYSKLRVWMKNKDGKECLLSLQESDVGAIYLGNVTTNYSMLDSKGNLDGMLRQSGVYLHEDGSAGLIQQIDLANQRNTYVRQAE